MEQKEIDELVNRWVHPTDEHIRKHIDIYTEKAEKYFVDLMKLIISLSTGMIAYWGVVSSAKIVLVSTKHLDILFVLYFISILLACATILSLDIHFKKFANDFADKHRIFLKYYKEGNWTALKKWREDGFSDYVGGKGRGWQIITVSLGIGALITFLVSLGLTCWPLVKAATY